MTSAGAIGGMENVFFLRGFETQSERDIVREILRYIRASPMLDAIYLLLLL